jgi:tetratricopeptide (TPR) repeat protein/tRNA A-37 threonylcarbamoyl transferase component Bud32
MSEADKDAVTKYGPQFAAVRSAYASDREKYKSDPRLLMSLIRQQGQVAEDPAAIKAFYHMIGLSPDLNGPLATTKAPVDGTDPQAATPSTPPPADGAPRPTPANGADAFLGEYARQNPGQAWASRELGASAFSRHDFQSAYAQFLRALQSNPKDVQALQGCADSAYQLGDYATAARAAQAVLALAPDNQDALSIYHFSKDRAPTVSLPGFDGANARVASGATDADASPQAGTAALENGRPSGMSPAQLEQYASQARAGGQDAIARSAQTARDAANRLQVGDSLSAYQLATEAVQLNPSNAQALNYRAMALGRMGRDKEAVQDASAALALAPGNATALQTRGLSLAKLGLYRQALADADATLAASPQNAVAWQNKAFALAGLGDRAGTLEALSRSAAADPRFQGRLERALQLPQDADLKLLFQDAPAAGSAAASPAPSPASRNGRFLRLMILTAIGGLLIALGTLHVVSSSWREGVRATVRRVVGGSGAASAAGAAGESPSPGTGAFWTQYGLVKEIGLGGMGVVYEAIDRSLERRVAVKRMRDEIRLDPHDRRRFVNEARLVAQLHHPNIVDIYGIVEDGADVYLVFEFVEGRTLSDALKSDGALDFAQARRVLTEMAAAVAHAHGRGVIHRDLKPSNVMLTPDGRVKVMDFGIARQAKEAATRRSAVNTYTIAGTPPYMSPEQEQGTVRPEADVYALGVCFYEMLTGQLPFGGVGGGMLLNKLNNRLTPVRQRVPSLPSGVDEVLARALAADPEKRYHTPAEFADALAALGSPAPLTPR